MLPCILLQNNLKISKIMKTTTVDKFKRFIALGTATVTVFFMQLNVACSQVGEKTDKTLSPYFFIKSDNPEVNFGRCEHCRSDCRCYDHTGIQK